MLRWKQRRLAKKWERNRMTSNFVFIVPGAARLFVALWVVAFLVPRCLERNSGYLGRAEMSGLAREMPSG